MQSAAAFQPVFLARLILGHLLSLENQPLLHGWNAFLLLHAFLDLGYRVIGLDVDFDLATGEGTDSVGQQLSVATLA